MQAEETDSEDESFDPSYQPTLPNYTFPRETDLEQWAAK